MRTILCQNIINGERCNKPRRVKKQAHRTKYCPECAGDIQRKQSRKYYRKNHSRIRELANEASKKRPSKPNLFHSSTKRTKCKCPACEEIHHMSLFLYDPDGKYENKPFPKRCHGCAINLSNYDFCPDADGYGVGAM